MNGKNNNKIASAYSKVVNNHKEYIQRHNAKKSLYTLGILAALEEGGHKNESTNSTPSGDSNDITS
jgi:uncharacterized protein YciI